MGGIAREYYCQHAVNFSSPWHDLADLRWEQGRWDTPLNKQYHILRSSLTWLPLAYQCTSVRGRAWTRRGWGKHEADSEFEGSFKINWWCMCLLFSIFSLFLFVFLFLSLLTPSLLPLLSLYRSTTNQTKSLLRAPFTRRFVLFYSLRCDILSTLFTRIEIECGLALSPI